MNPLPLNEPVRVWLVIGEQGLVMLNRIVAIAAADAAPIRRLLAATPLTKIVNLTGGRRRRSVIILDSDHVVLTPLATRQLRQYLLENGYEQ